VTAPVQRRDERIKHATRSINRTVLVFAVVVIVLISIVGAEEARNRQLAKDNRASLHVIAADQRAFERFRVQRTRDVNATAVLICRKQNAQSGVLADLIRRLLALPPRPGQSHSQAESRRILGDALPKLKPENCTRLPTRRGANPKTKEKK
jgi:hypothetical protein